MSDRQSISIPQLASVIDRSDVVLIGEAHDNKDHHRIQLEWIRYLADRKVPFAIGLEMFESGSQKALDDWTRGKISEDEFRLIYAKNWSLDWGLYRDIFLFARDRKIPLLGLNVPKESAVKVARKGFASLTPEEKKGLPEGASADLDNPHTPFLEKIFKKVFLRNAPSERVFTFFCEAQSLRNSGMASNIIRFRKGNPGTKVVALAGVWHSVKNAIPDQLKRMDEKQATVVIIPEITELNRRTASAELVDYMIGE